VGYDAPSRDVSIVHYTLGGPYFTEYRNCEFADDWRRERDEMLKVAQRQHEAIAASQPAA
jgi:hypothetical protein